VHPKCTSDCVPVAAGSTLSRVEENLLSPGQTLKSYILWTHPRGGLHYDVMVTVILAFIFLTPRNVFKDSPNYLRLHPNEIVVRTDGPNAFVYELNASGVAASESDAQQALKKALDPIAGAVEITRYEPLRDNSGKITGYRVWARRL
jgi:hypothetical protein